jgi:hypothetical protein
MLYLAQSLLLFVPDIVKYSDVLLKFKQYINFSQVVLDKARFVLPSD